MTDQIKTKTDYQNSESVTSTTEDGIPTIVNGVLLSDVAIQALREARARREQNEAQALPVEINGPKRNVEPTRYGDWEKDGKLSDF